MFLCFNILFLIIYVSVRENNIFKKTGKRVRFSSLKVLKCYPKDAFVIAFGLFLLVLGSLFEIFFGTVMVFHLFFKTSIFRGCFYLGILIFLFIITFFLIERVSNYIGLKKWGKNILYLREFPNQLSPASVSYLIHRRGIGKKELNATILNLYVKGYIRFEIFPKMFFEVIEKEVGKDLSLDEIYVLDWIKSGMSHKFHLYEWRKIIRNENKKYVVYENNFSKPLILFFCISFVLCFISLNLYDSFFWGVTIVFAYLFFYHFVMYILSSFFKKTFSLRLYTKKGYKTLDSWFSFRRFLKEFTLLHERKLEAVVLYRGYLAYSLVLSTPIFRDYIEDEKIKQFLDIKNKFVVQGFVEEILESARDINNY